MIKFKPNTQGVRIGDLWEEEKILQLVKDYHGICKLDTSLLYNCNYIIVYTRYDDYYPEIFVKELWDMYKCAMYAYKRLDSRFKIYFPTKFEFDYDTKIERMIENVGLLTGVDMKIDPDTRNDNYVYNQNQRLRLLSNALYVINFGSIDSFSAIANSKDSKDSVLR